MAALLNDLRQDLSLLDAPPRISSIFIGGGTPSLFSANALHKLLAGIAKLVPLAAGLEITLEANPGTFESKKFGDYYDLGINRLSIGIQSFNDQQLQQLGRVHSAQEALTAVEIARQAGFDNVNLDLMFGLPKQTHAALLKDVETAIALRPSHISYYQLTLEPNTYFHKFPPRLPTADAIFSGQQQCQQLLADAGYQHYEISAYAKPDAQCQHNLNYWHFGDYLGIGAGAHGKLSSTMPTKIRRTLKPKNPGDYLKNTATHSTQIPIDALPVEYLMNHLRLKSGFNLAHYQTMTGLNATTLEPALTNCVEQGWLIKQRQQFFCSSKGWDFLDLVLEQFMP